MIRLLPVSQELKSLQLQFLSIAVAVLLPGGLMHAEDFANRLEAKVSFEQKSGEVCVTIAGEVVATYVYADSDIPRPYFAHVRGPGGVQLTRNFPPIEGQDQTDHDAMHPGIWMGFGDLSGTDIWRNKGRVVHQHFVEQPVSGSGQGAFAVENLYQTTDGQPICREVCRYTILVRPEGYLLLWDSTFSSDNEFYFGDQEEMGLGVRLATPIAVNHQPGGRILDSEGRRNGSGIWGKTADWCDYSGTIEGRFAGITIMPHPDNFRPCWWHARDYGFVAANPFGRTNFGAGPPSKVVVRPNSVLRLRFGLLIHVGLNSEALDLPGAYQDYLASCQTEHTQP